MSLKYVDAERLIRFLEDFIKEIDGSPCKEKRCCSQGFLL